MELGGQRFASPDGAACQPYLCGVCESSALCPCSSVRPDPVLANLSFSQKKNDSTQRPFLLQGTRLQIRPVLSRCLSTYQQGANQHHLLSNIMPDLVCT
jgi:hypothetical protein